MITPIGEFRIKYILYRKDRVKKIQSKLKMVIIKKNMSWCDDPASKNYNRMVNLPFRTSYERLFRKENIYDIILVLDYNMNPIKKNKGSAIFIHIAKKNYKKTDALAKHQKSLNKTINYFIQVNIGNEIQKSGIPVSELDPFYNYCAQEIDLKIIGLMVIPPNDNNSEKYFKSLNELNKSLALKNLSMGMSADYIDAIRNGATFVRIGSSIFGARS